MVKNNKKQNGKKCKTPKKKAVKSLKVMKGKKAPPAKMPMMKPKARMAMNGTRPIKVM